MGVPILRGEVSDDVKRTSVARGPTNLDAADVAQRLRERCPGLLFDILGNQGRWSPRQKEFQGVQYLSRHICGMDRGRMPEWPEWAVKRGLVRTSMGRAMREDLPILSFDPFAPKDPNPETAWCMSMLEVPDRIIKIGWRETFRRILDAGLPGLTKTWLEQEFRISLQWYGSPESPVAIPEAVEIGA